MAKIIHYIGLEWDSKFIIAETLCKRSWENIEDHTSNKEHTTCKKCLKKLASLK